MNKEETTQPENPQERDKVISFQLNVPTVDLQQLIVQPEALALVPIAWALEHNVLPLTLEDNTLTVVTDSPGDLNIFDTLAALTNKEIKTVIPMRGNLRDAITSYYATTVQGTQTLMDILAAVQVSTVTDEATGLAEAASEAPIVKAVDLILTEAVKERASDIHIVPEETILKVRYRIDGVLHDSASLPRGVQSAILTRLKILADMNIAERRRPQDGSFTDQLAGKEIDFRVATIGTNWGESAVLRVLDKSFNLFELEQIGMPPYLREKYEASLTSPFGMIIISGPTGSGKTTTLYASLLKLDAKERNIMSIEDPIEYKFDGVRQIQVNFTAGINFASGLRACMRMDPDVILVGEIRDAETAQTAVTAALTGHLVLTSLHANNAVGALVRLVDLGVEPFLVTSAVVATASQRLVRRLCPICGELKEASPADIAAYRQVTGEEQDEFHYGTGCDYCSFTGYRGRIGSFELLPVTDSIRSLITQRASSSEISAQAQEDGMLPMLHHGMSLAKEGVTTPGEVARNVFTIG
ncbi:MAG: type II/IV secretion system protein [Dehalococcoidia bacterium]|nr:type II/IV secretion system protein [Dehalococcoidia bacterium]